jgi:subtilisin-like proprotein convertase family protein
MKFLSFVRLFGKQWHLDASASGRASRRSHKSRLARRKRLNVETLEDRTLMSVVPVATVTGHFDNLSFTPGNHSAPAVAVDPLNPKHLAAIYTRNDPANLPTKTPVIVEAAVSVDGGQNWSQLFLPGTMIDPTTSGASISPFPQETDGNVAFDANHNFYLVYSEHPAGALTPATPGAIVEQKFSFVGSSPVQTITNKVIYEWLQDPAINPVLTIDTNPASFTDPTSGVTKTDPYAGTVYVAWTTNFVPPPSVTNFNANSVLMVASSDGGKSFSPPFYANGNFNFGSEHDAAPQIVVSGGTTDGRVSPGQVSVVYDDWNSGANITPVPLDFINYNSFQNGGPSATFQGATGPIADAFHPQTGPDIPAVTNFTATVNITDPNFTAITKLDVGINLTHANLDNLLIQLIRPDDPKNPLPEAQRTIDLVFNRTNADGSTNTGFGISGANMGSTPSGIPLDTIFDDDVPRNIDGGNSGAPYTGYFQPEQPLSFFAGLTPAQINGTWTLRLTDFRNSGTPVQGLNEWHLQFTSGLTMRGEQTIASTTVRGAVTGPYSLQAQVAGNQGIGPAPVIASDSTLGSFSPYQGNIYVAFVSRIRSVGTTNNNPADNTDISLITSSDGGASWSFPVTVNTDNAQTDGSSEAFNNGTIVSGRAQFLPALTVDQTTGALVASWYDARNSPVRQTVARYVGASIDGGQTFNANTWLNQNITPFDEVTQTGVTVGPLADDFSSTDVQFDQMFGFGNRQSITALNGQVYGAWSGNEGLGRDGKEKLNVLSATATIAAGPRIISSTQGVAAAPLNTMQAPDGTILANTFDVTFDRPVDPGTFTPGVVTVMFLPANGKPAVSLTVSSVTPLDLGGFGPANAQGATQFQIKFDPSNAFAQDGTFVGTYSYSIAPLVQDRVRSTQVTLNTLQTGTFATANNLNLRIPPVGTGGSGIPSQDTTLSTLNVSGIPANQIITNVTVSLNLTHTFDADLFIQLIAPDGTSVVLAQNEGGSGDNYQGTTFSDAAGRSIRQGRAPFTGTFRPETPLANLLDHNPNGKWTLSIDDEFQQDTGFLQNWSLQISTGTVVTTIVPGNNMDQNADGTAGQANVDAYAVPRPLNGVPFQGPFDTTTIPLIVPGPHISSSSVPGGVIPPTPDNEVLNGTVSSIDVVFDRNMNPGSVTPASVLRVIGPAGTIGPGGAIPASFSITPNPNNNDPDPAHPRTFAINFLTPNGLKPLALNLSGTYVVTLASSITSAAGDGLDSNENAGLDILRGTPSAGTQPVMYNSTGTASIGDLAKPGTVTQSTITVPDSFIIPDDGITVQLNISYSHDPDLTVKLIAPNGQIVQLFSNIGANGNNQNFTNTVLDDKTNPILSITQGSPPFTGRFNPEVPLSNLFPGGAGINAQGQWTLQITDSVAGTVGTLNNWSITVLKPLASTDLGEPVADQAMTTFRIFTMDPTNPLSRSTWTSVGPAATSGGGRIGGIAVDPSDPSGNTVYVAGASGGVWKTTNFLTTSPQGPTYMPLTDFGPTFGINIGGLGVFGRNNNTSQSIVFAGTGEGDTGTEGVGFLRSLDGGATWTLLDSTTNVDANGNTLPLNSPQRDHIFVGTHTFKVLVDPRPTPSGNVIVYAALTGPNGGVWRSLDSGNHWQRMRAGQVTDLVFDPNSAHINQISNPTGNTDILFAGFAGEGVFESPNRGTVWNQLLGGVGDPLIQDGDNFPNPPIPVTAPPSTPNGAFGRIELAKPALTGVFLPDGTYTGDPVKDLLYEGWLYAGVINTSGHVMGLYLTKDFGENWTLVHLGNVQSIIPGLVPAIPSNNTALPNYDVGGGGSFSQGNYDFSLGINPVNPNVVYMGGTADGQPTGFIRVDVTAITDPHSLWHVAGPDPSPTTLRNFPQFVGAFINPVDEPVMNLIRDPADPFNGDATIDVSNTASFTNIGYGATWIPFDIAGTDQHRMVTELDPLTGLSRIIIGDDQGIFTAVDNNGILNTGVANETDPENSANSPASRNGNLQVAQFYYGAAQPSDAAAQIAVVRGLFYSGVQDGASTVSAVDVLSAGNLAWTNNGEGDGGGVATDQTGAGTLYQYMWPCCGGNKTDFFQVNNVGRTFGLIQQSQPGLVPDPQWPFTGVGNFAVNPIDGDQAIISSFAGRIFSTADQGRTWNVIGDPAALDGTQSLAMTFGAPDPADQSGALNDFLYVGTNAGHIFVTFNGGGANGNQWTNLSAGLDGSAIQAIITNPNRGSHEAYAVTLNGVYHMVDSKAPGATWQNITGNLLIIQHKLFTPFNDATQFSSTQPAYLTSITADWRYAIPNNPAEYNNPANPAGPSHPALYVGGEGGIYRSLDNGVTWTVFPDVADDGAAQDGGYLPNAHVTDLHMALGNINPTTGHPIVLDPITGAKAPDVIYATTYGRGAFAIRAAPVVVNGSLQLDPNLPGPFGSNPGPVSGTTNVLTPVIDGMSEQSAFNNTVKIQLFDLTSGTPVLIGVDPNNSMNNFVLTDSTGRFKIQVAAGYFKPDGSTDGVKTLGIQPTDAAGVVGNMFKFTFTLDTTPVVHSTGPTAPHFDTVSPLGANQGGSDSGLTVPVLGFQGTFADRLTRVTQPIVDGAISQAAPPVTVELIDEANPNTVIGSGQTDANGNYSIRVNPGVYKNDGTTDGPHVLDVIAVHIPRNSNVVELPFTLDTVAPATPLPPSLTPDSNSGSDKTQNITNVTTPTFSGTGEAKAQVQLFANGILVGTDLVNNVGNYTVTATTALSDGVYDVTVQIVDFAGNASPVSAAMSPKLIIRTKAPTVPTLKLDPNFATAGKPNTTAAIPSQYDGTSDPNTSVVIFDNGVQIDSFAEGANSSFIRQLNLSDGQHLLTVTATDSAGNTSTFAPANPDGRFGLEITVNQDALDASRKFVREIYNDALGRPGTLAEWNQWLPTLGQANGRFLVANAINRSLEARDFVVTQWYSTYLGRQPLSGEEKGWANLMFTNHQTEEQTLAQILGTQEYFNHAAVVIGQPASNTTFVMALFKQVLNRTGSPAEVNGWVAQIPTIGRSGVAQAFLTSLEYREDVVRSYYITLLRRPTLPSIQEIDSWAKSSLDILSIRVGFESSVEFYFRVTGFMP